MTSLPRVQRFVPPDPDKQAAVAADLARVREEFVAARLAAEPARRKAIADGPQVRDIDAALACGCSCHPRPADSTHHDGGMSCPCQLTDEQRAASREEFLAALASLTQEEESFQNDLQERVARAADRLQVDVRYLGGAAPFVIRGVADGRGFYLRERHDLWSVVIAPDDDPGADPWGLDHRVPVIEVASGASDSLEIGGRFDHVHALEVAVEAVRLFLLRRSCAHVNAQRFCPDCGVQTTQAAAWQVHVRTDD